MGTDIHAYVEVQISGAWRCVGMLPCEAGWDRNHQVFGALAGVKQPPADGPPYPPRGVPDDMSEITRMAYQDEAGDTHHEHWLTAVEFYTALHWAEMPSPWDRWADTLATLSMVGCPARIVFWFDN